MPLLSSKPGVKRGTVNFNEEILQLAEVAPTRRPRCMYVFVHESVAPEQETHFRRTMWQAVRRPSLGGMRAVFPGLASATEPPL